MDISGLAKKIKEIPDSRRAWGNLRHKLEDIFVTGLAVFLCGGEDFEDMEQFGLLRERELRMFLELPHGIPDESTFFRVFTRVLKTEQTLRPEEADQLERRWESKYGAVRAGRKIAVLGKGTSFEALSFTPEVVKLFELKRWNLYTILAKYGIPPRVANISDKSASLSGKDTAEQHSAFWGEVPGQQLVSVISGIHCGGIPKYQATETFPSQVASDSARIPSCPTTLPSAVFALCCRTDSCSRACSNSSPPSH